MVEAITVGGPNATLPDLYQLDLWVKAPATEEVIAAENELHDLADQGSPTEDAWMASFEEGAPKYGPEQLYILQQVD